MLVADVAVVGGGPAGAAAAISLARAGRDVVLLDKAAFPRDKVCGDGLTTGALRLLEDLGLDPTSVPSWQRVEDLVVTAPSHREVTFPLPRRAGTYAVVARRAELDTALLDLARVAGVRVHDGHAVRGAEERTDRVVLEVEGMGSIGARYAIGADGMWSSLRKHLGVATPGYLGEWHAFRQYFTEVGPRAATEQFVWFEPDLLPGYAWSFPLPGRWANVGFGIQRDGGKVARVQDMKQIWPELLERPHIKAVLGPDARPDAPHKAWPIPARIDRAVLSTTRTLFVGDAAATTDIMTGEGIGQALLTGVLAASAIEGYGLDAASVTAAYDRSVHASLDADHRMSLLLLRVLRHRAGVRAAVRIAGASDWTRRSFARWLFEDYPRAVLATPRRWHRGLLTAPGAYRDEPRAPGTS
ncbi:MAG: geranylgeranyl reductase family protein [Acidimicrobiales bacterium]